MKKDTVNKCDVIAVSKEAANKIPICAYVVNKTAVNHELTVKIAPHCHQSINQWR